MDITFASKGDGQTTWTRNVKIRTRLANQKLKDEIESQTRDKEPNLIPVTKM